jgi:transcriptional regulator with XRE-family HTH domain
LGFGKKAQYLIISEMLKSARKEAKFNQAELSAKTGTKMSYISRIENAKTNIPLSLLI